MSAVIAPDRIFIVLPNTWRINVKFKKKLFSALLAGAVVAGFASTTQAAVVFNQTLGSPPNIFGNGVADTNFALGTFLDAGGDAVEIGLRARYRVRPTQPSDSSGLYGPFSAGTQTAAFGSPARTDRAQWSYDFYINTGSAGSLADFTFQLCADSDRGPGVLADCVNPVSFFSDNRIVGNELGNSMQLFFPGTPGNIGYDVNAAGLYSFSLSVSEGATLLGTTEITAQVIPEPSTLALLGLSLAGLGFARRRKQS